MATTPEQAATIFRRIAAELAGAVAGALNVRLRFAQALSVTKYMQGLGSGRNAAPPNPPPGPLGIRSGNLRRTVDVIPARGSGSLIIGGLRAGGDGVGYAGIHEFGGRVPAHLIVAKPGKVLAWAGRDGATRFSRRVNHPGSNIPARPYLHPALEEAIGDQAVFEGYLRDWVSSLGAN